MNYGKKSLKLHFKNKGKIEIKSKISLKTKNDLACAYTPGVAEVCLAIAKDKKTVYDYTSRNNLIAIVTDGSRVLGLGNIGPEAALPVMEGKAILFKKFGNVDAIPICLATQDTEEIIKTVKNIAPVFGAINLEDIASPKCFEIEKRLKKELDIPVFHDDQEGTAIAILAGLINGLKLSRRKIAGAKIILCGAGAAGNATAKLLTAAGAKNLIVCDSKGAIYNSRVGNDKYKTELASLTNPKNFQGTMAEALINADVFIGVSAPKILTREMIRAMAKNPIIFALANPIGEITPEEAKKAGAKIIGAGRSDYPNQINNLLVFPGLFRGILDARVKEITDKTKIAAAYAIANLVPKNKLAPNYIIPSALDKRVAKAVAKAVKK
ncbi:NADP-dependent malic enzyme [Patescibacteria group bacterium]|nr:NADP-dependent malic enzyme [Patescibacteria group bacterium]MBU4579775.1 NADP-dependent malic enzyme [Patescibacteria group bacterium]